MRVAALIVLSLSVAYGQQAKQANRESELRKAIAAGLVELSSWCVSKKLVEEARPLIDEALALDADNAKAKDLKGKATGDSAASETDQKEYPKKLETYGKKLSAFYRELFAQKHLPNQQTQWDGWLVRAYQLDLKATAPLVETEWRDAFGKKDWTRAQRLLGGAEMVKSDPARAKALKEVELKAAETSAVLKKATAHEMQYYLALPKGWSPAKKWPILVAVEGAGCNFLGMMNGHLGVRGDRPFIIVVPVTFTNTNALEGVKAKYPYPAEVLEAADRDRMGFDEPGLLAVLEDVRREFSGQDKFYVTGFSGGGNLSFRMTFAHPDMLVASAPACPNFGYGGKVSDAPEREALPVMVFQGDKDEYLNMLESQWLSAKQLFDRHGFKNVGRTMLPGVGHSGCPKEVQEFFDKHLKKP